jgi:hypothetical protein
MLMLINPPYTLLARRAFPAPVVYPELGATP